MLTTSTALPLRPNAIHSVFLAMRGSGPISRAELSRRTGLSKQTLSEVVRKLEIEGWIRHFGQTKGAIGRRADTYILDDKSVFVLCADLGGTKLNVGIANIHGALLGEITEPTDKRGGKHVLSHIRTTMLKVAIQAGIDPSRIVRGAIGSPGIIDQETGRIHMAANIADLDQFNVAENLQRELGFPVIIENDVNLAALGEYSHEGRQKLDNFAFISLGTGIGMGIIANGQLLRGHRGCAGEIAYLPLGGDPFDSRGYIVGTLENAIGTGAILDRYQALGGKATSVQAIFDHMNSGNITALRVLDDIARLLSQTIMAVSAILDSGLVVLGGSIGSRKELVQRVSTILNGWPGPQPLIQSSMLGNKAVLRGALNRVLETLFENPF